MKKDTRSRARLREFSADFATIKAIHRGAGAFVSFLRRPQPDADNLETLGCCPVEELEEHLPQLLSLYPHDLYFSINSFSAGRGPGRDGLRWTLRTEANARYLNAVTVDLDAGRPNTISAADALQGLCDAIQDGIIPQPSMVAQSGRGVYALWLLHDADEQNQPPQSWQEKNTQHKRISREMVTRLSHLNADGAATDVARVLRVPGSTNSKNGQPVEWQPMPNENGTPTSYTLDELETLLSLKQKRQGTFYGRRTKRPGSAPQRRAGAVERAQRRVTDVEAIEADRGGWRQGHRWTRLTTYARLLRVTDSTPDQIANKVQAMADRCQPPFPSNPSDGTTAQIVNDALDSTHHAWNISEAKLVSAFGVTEAQARRLELRSILPLTVRAEREAEQKASRRPSATVRRQDAIRAALDAQPDASAAEVLDTLKTQGIEASPATIKRDLRELFPDRQARPAGRPSRTKSPQTTSARSISKGFEPIFSEPIPMPNQTGKLPLAPTGEAALDSAPHTGQRLCPSRPLFRIILSQGERRENDGHRKPTQTPLLKELDNKPYTRVVNSKYG